MMQPIDIPHPASSLSSPGLTSINARYWRNAIVGLPSPNPRQDRRWHQTLKNRILQENYFLLGDLEARVEALVDHNNNQCYHESLNNVTPSDVYFGRDKAIRQ
jgi:hypothetical protein